MSDFKHCPDLSKHAVCNDLNGFTNLEYYKERDIRDFIKRIIEENEAIKNPKICPKCKKKLAIVDSRGGFCTEHYWIVPSRWQWIQDGFNKRIKELAGKKLITSNLNKESQDE